MNERKYIKKALFVSKLISLSMQTIQKEEKKHKNKKYLLNSNTIHNRFNVIEFTNVIQSNSIQTCFVLLPLDMFVCGVLWRALCLEYVLYIDRRMYNFK